MMCQCEFQQDEILLVTGLVRIRSVLLYSRVKRVTLDGIALTINVEFILKGV